MNVAEVGQFISAVGFPCFVAVYYMVVGHRDSKANTSAIEKMAQALDNNTATIRMLHGGTDANGTKVYVKE